MFIIYKNISWNEENKISLTEHIFAFDNSTGQNTNEYISYEYCKIRF